MQITLRTAAWLKQEECLPNVLVPCQLLVPEGKEKFPVWHSSTLGMREEGRWALGPSCLAEELTAAVVLY